MSDIDLGLVIGPHFTPSVDREGNLSWTNNGELENPAPVNIKGEPATINGVNTLTIDAGNNVTVTQSGDTLRISATDTVYDTATTSADGLMSAADKEKLDTSNRFTDADVLTLETAGEKSNAAFSAIDDLLTGLQVPVYKRYISYGVFHLNAPSGGKLDDFHVSSSMSGQTVYVALLTPFYVYRSSENNRVVTDPEPVIRTATVAADGSVNASFSLNSRDYYIFVTTTDLDALYSPGEDSGEIKPVRILFTCRYTRNTGVFMGLDNIPGASMPDFADKLGYSLRYEQITDMTPEAVVTTTSDAVFMYDGSEYYELAGTKPSEIPNQNATYYRCLYQRKEL